MDLASCLETSRSLQEASRLEEALEALEGADAGSAAVCRLRGEIEFALGRFQDAALSYTALATAEPTSADAQYNLAVSLTRLERWDAACPAFRKALRIDPLWEEARIGLGLSLLHLNLAAEAIETFTQCRGTGGDRRPAFGRAVALQLLRRLPEARAAYEMLLRVDPEWRDVLSNLVSITAETADLEALHAYSQRLLHLDPRSVAALQGLATIALYQGDAHAAAAYCDRILEAAPGCLEASHNFSIATDRMLSDMRGPSGGRI